MESKHTLDRRLVAFSRPSSRGSNCVTARPAREPALRWLVTNNFHVVYAGRGESELSS